MTTAVLPKQVASEQRLLLDGVTWETYDQLLRLFEGRHLRLNYDRGRLEIMTTSGRHERWNRLSAHLDFNFFEFPSGLQPAGGFGGGGRLLAALQAVGADAAFSIRR
ncbi:MAG: hypothetical protein NT069_30630, partial [Planctomycetota bacterium]|nr:hypothetical protein [Planctomycetota bacterium]